MAIWVKRDIAPADRLFRDAVSRQIESATLARTTLISGTVMNVQVSNARAPTRRTDRDEIANPHGACQYSSRDDHTGSGNRKGAIDGQPETAGARMAGHYIGGSENSTPQCVHSLTCQR